MLYVDDYNRDDSGSGMSRGQSRRGGGHPPNLRGKDIGLYYRDKQKAKNARKESKDILPIKLKAHTEQQIESLIETPRNSFDKYFQMKEQNIDNTDLESRYNHINDSQFKQKFLNIISGNLQDNLRRSLIMEPKLKRNESMDIRLLDELNEIKASVQYRNMLKFRAKLPSYEKRHEILDLIYSNQVVLISGETGKSQLRLIFDSMY